MAARSPRSASGPHVAPGAGPASVAVSACAAPASAPRSSPRTPDARSPTPLISPPARPLQAGSSSAVRKPRVDEQRLDGVRRHDLDAHGRDRHVLARRARSSRRRSGVLPSRSFVRDLGRRLRERLDVLEDLDRLLALAHEVDVRRIGVRARDEHVRQAGGRAPPGPRRAPCPELFARIASTCRRCASARPRPCAAPAPATTRCGSASSRSRRRRARRTARACPRSRA